MFHLKIDSFRQRLSLTERTLHKQFRYRLMPLSNNFGSFTSKLSFAINNVFFEILKN